MPFLGLSSRRYHSAPQIPHGQIPSFTVVISHIWKGDCRACKDQPSLGHIQAPSAERVLSFGFVERDVHLMLLQKIVKVTGLVDFAYPTTSQCRKHEEWNCPTDGVTWAQGECNPSLRRGAEESHGLERDLPA